MVLLFCWVGMVGIKSGNACGKDKDENAVVLPVYERNGRMYVEIEQTYLGREWMVLGIRIYYLAWRLRLLHC